MANNDQAKSRDVSFTEQRLHMLEQRMLHVEQRMNVPALLEQQTDIYKHLHGMTIQHLALIKMHSDKSLPKLEELLGQGPPPPKDSTDRLMETVGTIMGLVTELQAAATPGGAELAAQVVELQREISAMKAATT